MKTTLILPFLFISIGFISFGQEKGVKAIENVAKEKMEAQDFNNTRSNRRTSKLQEDSPAPAPPPASTQSALSPTDSLANLKEAEMYYSKDYFFNQQLKYSVENAIDNSSTLVTISIGLSSILTERNTGKGTNIADLTRETLIHLNETDKSGNTFSTRWDTDRKAQPISGTTQQIGDKTITKTGQTKTISGLMCEEYIIQEPKAKYVYWIAPSAIVDYSKLQIALSQQMNAGLFTNAFNEQGLMVEMTSYSKKGDIERTILLTNFEQKSTQKSLNEYRIAID